MFDLYLLTQAHIAKLTAQSVVCDKLATAASAAEQVVKKIKNQSQESLLLSRGSGMAKTLLRILR